MPVLPLRDGQVDVDWSVVTRPNRVDAVRANESLPPWRIGMQKFFRSGAAFLLVALLCLAAGLISRNGSTFTIVAVVWLMLAIIVRGKNAKKPSERSENKKEG